MDEAAKETQTIAEENRQEAECPVRRYTQGT
jgi:hypothetical protein